MMNTMWRDNPPMSKSPLRFFIFSSVPHWKAALTAISLAFIANVVVAVIPYVFKLVVEGANVIVQGGSYSALMGASVLYLTILLVSKLLWRASGFAAARWATGASATGRYALSSYITLHSRAYFSDRFAGSLMNKIRHAATGLRDVIDISLWDFFELAITALASIVLVWFTSPLVAAIFIAWLCLILALNAYLGFKRVPLAVRAHSLETAVNGATVDLLSNVSAMQEYARREFEIQRLKGMIEDRRRAHLKSWYYGEWTRLYNGLLLAVFGGAMVFMTIYLAQMGLLSLGDIVLVLTVIFRIEGQLQSLGSNFNHFAEICGEIKESLEEIIEPHEIPDSPGAKQIQVGHADIEFRDATFRYGDNAIFSGLNLRIAAGQRVGLVGRSGAGKSTLIRLIMRHHNLEGGQVLIGGTDIAAVTQESLRNAISIVPQEPLLFHRTIRENIQYGDPQAPIEKVYEAAKLAQADDFIVRLHKKYESMVGERGVKLSGGERQRIIIARAILKNAPILLLDEATSALDSESEVAIQKALKELMQGKTVIAIAHRLSTLREMDRILVMDRGQVVEDGTHDELVKKGGIYAELWSHQAGGFLADT